MIIYLEIKSLKIVIKGTESQHLSRMKKAPGLISRIAIEKKKKKESN